MLGRTMWLGFEMLILACPFQAGSWTMGHVRRHGLLGLWELGHGAHANAWASWPVEWWVLRQAGHRAANTSRSWQWKDNGSVCFGSIKAIPEAKDERKRASRLAGLTNETEFEGSSLLEDPGR
ncbi:hypothetical protein SASPL_116289 [Salvia splendens]|uniref:Secreted protein n=1 Tax=Salvia splendens TaxID=180675 RepID=A0A8X8ZV94_SALSN|nr:hypothetical protein SASPL_116289 [Salvia splendens]